MFYAIRHKASGLFMPLIARGRGYTQVDHKNWTRLDIVPRLFHTEHAAKIALMCYANGSYENYYSEHFEYGREYEGVRCVDVGRNRDDYEVVPIKLMINDGDQA